MKLLYLYIMKKLCKSFLTTTTLLPCSVEFIQYLIFFLSFNWEMQFLNILNFNMLASSLSLNPLVVIEINSTNKRMQFIE